MKLESLKSSLTLLRLPFSLFLLPISLFSLYFIPPGYPFNVALVMIIWHLLVFPSSNGYNSYHDRDTGPIGGLAAPPLPNKTLLNICNVMDISAIFLSLLINIPFALLVGCYIIASRLYSNRQIRLKQFPITGFMVVFIFQGIWVFCANVIALSSPHSLTGMPVIFAACSCSFFIGALYPLTQIYQHQSDRDDGVNSLSMLLGKKSTFLFSAIMFILATVCIYFSFLKGSGLNNFWLFNIIMFPALVFFSIWAIRSFKDMGYANFRNTMIMLALSSSLINLYFIILLIK